MLKLQEGSVNCIKLTATAKNFVQEKCWFDIFVSNNITGTFLKVSTTLIQLFYQKCCCDVVDTFLHHILSLELHTSRESNPFAINLSLGTEIFIKIFTVLLFNNSFYFVINVFAVFVYLQL